ncbi:hypothetical protein HYX18_03260 [Candidatus Woesearchaeota archaeon]|nr:hypothetical protein [Candidatus Woesearchaeota archaeon]
MVNIKFSKIEKKHLILSIILLSVIFGFDDKRPEFVLSLWLSNFFVILILVSISLILHEMSHKIVANKIGAIADYRLWAIQRFGFRRRSALPITIFNFKINNFYIGAFLGILLAIVSKGKFIFAAIGQTLLSIDINKRAHKNLKELQKSEVISIAIIGPLVSLILIAIFKILGWNEGVLINSMLAIYSMLPFPRLDGNYIFFRSPFTYLFFVLFTLAFLLLINNINIIMTFIIALVLASLITIVYFYSSQK